MNKCRLSCPILDEKEATKDILDDSRDVGQRIDWLEGRIEAIKTVGAGHPPIRRNLVKTNWAVNSERQDKEDDVVDHPGGKLEQLDEKRSY